MPEETVCTIVPDDLYQELLDKARAARPTPIYELFDGDKEATKIWINSNDKLMSNMPPEQYDKQIVPHSKMDLRNLEASNGRGDLTKRLVDRGIPLEVATGLARQVYMRLPLSAYINPDKIDEFIQNIVSIHRTEA